MKKKRPGTRSGRRDNIGETDPFERVVLPRPKAKGRLPSDIVDAAEAALDDMLQRTAEIDEDEDILEEEVKTETRTPSHDEIFEQLEAEDDLLATSPKATTATTGATTRSLAAASKGTGSTTRSLGPIDRPSKMPLPAPPRTTTVQTVPRPSPHPHVTVSPRGTPAPPAIAAPPRTTAVPTRPTPTGPPTPRPSPFPRLRSGPTVGETPMTRREYSTSERDSIDPPTELPMHSPIDETAPVPDELIMDLESAPVELPIEFNSGPVTTDAQGYVPRSQPVPLQVVVFEDSAHLGSAQSAISASGHVVALGCSGRDGVPRALEALADGDVDVVVAALPGGEKIISAALAVEPQRPIVIASFGGMPLDAVARAQRVGADLAITRPHDVDSLAPIMLAASRLQLERRVSLVARGGEPSADGEESETEPKSLVGFDVFERLLELEIKRAQRYDYALSVALFAVEIDPSSAPSFIRGILRARAGNALIHALRDIDIATQLEHDRFFVLLPYTDLKGAAALGRRVIAAVAAGDPVISGGRTFPPRLIGAVAGGTAGQQLSFAKLMKDATRALEQARRDGAELAVQP